MTDLTDIHKHVFCVADEKISPYNVCSVPLGGVFSTVGDIMSPGGALECNLTGRCLHNPFRKKICILIPCFVIFRLQNNRKTIAYCS